MTRTKTILISVLLIISGIIINKLNDSQPDNELIGFFSGVVSGAGVAIFLQTIIKKKTDHII